MLDFSDPQKRERLLVIAAGVFLCGIVMYVLPNMFSETTNLKNSRQKLIKDIEDLELHAQNKEEIQDRLTLFENQALASSGSKARDEYQNWLGDLARSVGIRNYGSPAPTPTTQKGAGTKYTFTVTGTGRLDQIAEFLRRFHRTDYLHLIQSVQPRPSTRFAGEFDVTIKIESLALPQVRTVNIPGLDEAITTVTDEETEMLSAIRDRAILSAYTPPRPPPPQSEPTLPPPPIDFDDSFYCFVNAIVEVDGEPQCWIDYRTEGKRYYLFEGETFKLGEITCTIKKIEVKANRVQIAAFGGLYAVRLGKSLGQSDDPSYFITGIVDENAQRWSADSTGEPRCVIVYGSEEGARIREREKHILSVGDAFPMGAFLCTVKEIDLATHQVQIEVAGVAFTLGVGGSFSKFEE